MANDWMSTPGWKKTSREKKPWGVDCTFFPAGVGLPRGRSLRNVLELLIFTKCCIFSHNPVKDTSGEAKADAGKSGSSCLPGSSQRLLWSHLAFPSSPVPRVPPGAATRRATCRAEAAGPWASPSRGGREGGRELASGGGRTERPAGGREGGAAAATSRVCGDLSPVQHGRRSHLPFRVLWRVDRVPG